MTETHFQYNLEERTACFAENIILFVRRLKKDVFLVPLLTQLIRSSTSIGANYQEANGASSRKDFANKIHICKKEAKETAYWLRMVEKSIKDPGIELERLKKECRELILIFSKIASSTRDDEKNRK